jgi:hypothetical protein
MVKAYSSKTYDIKAATNAQLINHHGVKARYNNTKTTPRSTTIRGKRRL